MIYLICILAYLVLLAGIAVRKSRDVKDQSDFTVAGRSLSPWMMVCTMLAVWIGTGSVVGNAEQTYETGLAAMVLPVATFIGMALLSLIATRARDIEANTVPEIIERRFGALARNLAMVSLVIAYMVIVSYQFNAGGAVLEVIVGDRAILTAGQATLIAAMFIVFYAALAGLMSLAWMDLVTGSIIMLTMAIACPIYWFKAGGWTGIESAFTADQRISHLSLWGVYSPTQLINYILPVFLLILGDANQYQRIFASRSGKGARTAVTLMIFIAFAVELLIIACAWITSSMTPDPENGKYILIYAARHYLSLPLGCVFMVTVVGIIISTADSFLHVPATSVVNDLYLPYINPKASQKRILLVSRCLVIVFGVIAYLVTLMFSASTGFFEKALYAFTIYGVCITPSLVAALVWERATKQGSIASICAGAIVTLGWSELEFVKKALPAALAELDAVLPAITLSVTMLVVVSLLTRPGNIIRPTDEQ
ncbi:MAG: sodium:solute symporter family protein [Phycisphaera sp. RhM]|nr:sodium:solute symporter family protein [Phycisphaera sp. RhM]